VERRCDDSEEERTKGEAMAKQYQRSFGLRLANASMRLAVRLGIAPKQTYLLTVLGRRSGKPMTTPVNLVQLDGRRYLVAPFGERAWVKNARAAGRVTLQHGGKRETLAIEPATPEEAGPVLKQYLEHNSTTRSYFDAATAAPASAFVAEAAQHPVFRLTAIG
jgi:deazaflavin-dependent oxidoreductase (nitroreductase family)